MIPASSAVLFEKITIHRSIERIALSLVPWVEHKGAGGLTLISVLEGAKPFTKDLVEDMGRLAPQIKVKVHEVKVTGTEGTHLLEGRAWTDGFPDLSFAAEGLVLILDDLVDSGKTLALLRGHLKALGAEEVKTAVLIRKFGSESGPVDFCGFDLNLDRAALAQKGIKDYWLFGYGMDLDGQHRELDHVGWVEIR